MTEASISASCPSAFLTLLGFTMGSMASGDLNFNTPNRPMRSGNARPAGFYGQRPLVCRTRGGFETTGACNLTPVSIFICLLPRGLIQIRVILSQIVDDFLFALF